MKVEPFSQVYYLRIDIDVIQDVRDKAIVMAKLCVVIKKVATLFQRQSKVANDLCQRCDVIIRRSECVNALAVEARMRCSDDGIDGIETGVQAMKRVAELDVPLC